jgi:hypothetical protein
VSNVLNEARLRVLARGAAKSSMEWRDYFLSNAARSREIPWHLGPSVAPRELHRIASSLRGWQLGETSDGAHLMAAARDYARRTEDPTFLEAVQHFIKEEQRHGYLLGRFLDLAGVARARFDWGDAAFRCVRYCVATMEIWATPVVMVETHAMVYYGAIRRATGSCVLRAICQQILFDEVAHIRFQCERLAALHRNRSRQLRLATMAAQRVLFTGITIAVWLGHRRALRAGGYSFGRFWSSAWAKMGNAFRMMKQEESGPELLPMDEGFGTSATIVNMRASPPS